MAKFYTVGVSTMMLFAVSTSMAQQKISVSGRITDSQGGALSGVTIRERGGTSSTATSTSGTYTLSVPSNATLIISYVGYQNQEIAVNGKTTINVTLADASAAIDEVVVVGYGTQKKAKLLGSVSTIDAKQLENRAVTNVSAALSGLAAGVQVKVGNGKPGSDGATIRVRGVGTLNNNDALVIIDGIQGVMDAVNPEDIESISVLKDASSAAIYGARAANGVILITTKKGKNGQAPQINYSGLFSRTSPSVKPIFVSDYLRHMNLFNEAAANIGSSGPYTQSAIDAWTAANADPNGLAPSGVPNYVAYPNTNWGDWIYEDGWLQNHNVSVLGGSDKIRYNLSGRIQDNPGIMHNTGMKRYEGRVNLETDVTDFLTVGTQTFVVNEHRSLASDANLYNYLRQTTPGIYPMYDGKFGGAVLSSGESSQLNNILLYLYDYKGSDERTRLNSTFFANIKLWKGLTFETKFNYQSRFDETTAYQNPSAKYDFSTMNLVSTPTVPSQLSTGQSYGKIYRKSFDNVLRYNTEIGKHTVGVLIGHNEFYYNDSGFSASKKGLIDETITNIGTATEMASIGGYETDNSMRSFFGRVSYDYDAKYLAEFSLRRDGASKFGRDKKYGTFPSVSLGYMLSKEPFMEKVNPYIQDIKIRGSWGKLGNDGGDDLNVYGWHGVYGLVGYSFNGVQMNGLQLSRFGNDLLQWEEAENKEIGLEFAALNRRASMEVSLYDRKTSNIIRAAEVPITGGTTTPPFFNQAAMRNTGVEFNLNWRDQIGAFKYNIGGNFAYNKNSISKYEGKLIEGLVDDGTGKMVWQTNLGDVSSGGLNRILEDHQLNEFYLRKVYKGDGSYFNADGSVNIKGGPTSGMIRTDEDYAWAKAMKAAGYSFLNSNQKISDVYGSAAMYYGDLIYADLNQDGIYGNNADQYFTGTSSNPKYIYGINLGFSYKGFDMAMIWAGESGSQYYWTDHGYNSNILISGNQITTRIADDHYFYNPNTPDDARTNKDGYFPRLKYGTSAENINNQASDYWLYESNFFKLRNLQIGYTFNKKLTEKFKVRNLRVFFSGENLLMFTNFPGLDPEVGAGAEYPTMKQYAFGLNFGF
ncbi:TonB-dependent receptor [Sphingobacterium sp. SRCM116780]|uniref:SusC/RagA family TonB-linked outer membrane protein n=1 Tax=Sphingobacterium sp. SRCM116780 TaxID=2907623 RepID=UPI001F32E073|nr:TonB-dependent receptor [Sphingobacterium sp. SRCM116780]UIR55462.1 TonB-dependent receptor [Sphingobacterium sp. SRCM116780]